MIKNKLIVATLISTIILSFTGCVEEQKTTTPEDKTTPTLEQKAKIDFNKEKPLPVDTIDGFPGDGYKKKLSNGLEVEVVVMDKENGKAELRFSDYEISGDAYTFRGAEYRTPTFAEEPEWFQFSFVALGTNEIYIEDSSGHESMPRHFIVKNKTLVNLGELIKGILIDKFPKETFPQIGVTFYPSFIRIEEENYCCDTTYDATNPEREKYRKVFFLDRKTYNILKEDKVERIQK